MNKGEDRGIINTGFLEILTILKVHLRTFREKEIQGNNLNVRGIQENSGDTGE